ncbi:MAG: hypothetical protein B6U85_02485 [Desulfurococcales archaeon ex4484_42]|nr:MAG: hypothetical protein B6U85_02485 [Desulfurococcales archaeon ex4484_42]
MSSKIELELIEEYVYAGERRFRFRIKGTNIILNVEAEDVESGLKKAVDMIRKLKIIERLKELKSQ